VKRIIGILAACVMALGLISACGGKTGGAITVITREEGSGTRSAFIEIMGILQEDAAGNMADMTVDSAEVVNGTNLVMTSVAGNRQAIGYISMGSLNDTVKALKIDGAAATPENVISGDYRVARPFNIASMNGQYSEAAQDFVDFILSDEGQAVVLENGFISRIGSGPYAGGGMSGKIVCAGSTSVSPLMEKLAEAYKAYNPNVELEIQSSGSSAGMTSAIEGICDIGMSSRKLKDSELEKGLVPTVIAMDGIALIVNKENPVDGLTSAQVTAIYTGEITAWSQLGKAD
jgi:phosphate transport system substrate-binding protein